MPNGSEIVKLAARHVGERYILGAMAPKDNTGWTGPWDCAEFASWVMFQVSGKLYGCIDNGANPSMADAWSGAWARDAESAGERIGVERAARIAGAMVVRKPATGAIGHIAISDGAGGTVEAHSTNRGVIRDVVAGRRWDLGILVPGIEYVEGPTVDVPKPAVTILRLRKPNMKGRAVRRLQQALKAAGFHPGPIDGGYGPMTAAAVRAYQLAQGLNPDGEVGPVTAAALGIALE